MSEFYTDGFSDGYKGNHASPPAPYSFGGHVTNVFAAEYLDGWMDGRQSKREEPLEDMTPGGTSDAHADQFHC